ncbi:sensor histidine kinase [Aureimonas sp. AU40]|uniref:sensor histidine kinase n=1 Tax=Aureimonas sp. AU40 TaxID=1637747 RepID=UPI0007838A79|nr:histidine kinase dimerization/phosphoacceptor domain -containing protein [Aureimonas sp. AU40]
MARVLYIDDDEGLCRLISRAMARRGHAVETASGGAEGVARLRAESFELVAVDHYMPGMDGLETLAAIAALPDPPPVVYVTGSEEGRVAVAALKAGAADYVVKSVGEEFFDLLQSTFRQVLDRRRLLAEKAEAEAKLRISYERLEALLKEANHRVANSLQIVSAFVRLQASAATSDEARSALRDTQQRITAIAQVHRRLYNSDDLDLVEMSDYLATLLSEVEATWSTPLAPHRLHLSAEPIRLETDSAVSMGVLVAELVSNGFKYAYPPGVVGEIRVELRAEGSGFVLRVEDDGQGFDPAAAPKGTGTGSKLVKAMASSLGAEITQENTPRGFRVVVRATRGLGRAARAPATAESSPGPLEIAAQRGPAPLAPA